MKEEITKEDLQEMGLPIKKLQWATSKQKEEKFKKDKALFKSLNCKHYRTELNQVIDHKNDRVEYYEICLDCGKII